MRTIFITLILATFAHARLIPLGWNAQPDAASFRLYRDLEKSPIWSGEDASNVALVSLDDELHIVFATAVGFTGLESIKSAPLAILAEVPPPLDPPPVEPPPVVLPPLKELLQFQESEDGTTWETTATFIKEVSIPKRFFRMTITPLSTP